MGWLVWVDMSDTSCMTCWSLADAALVTCLLLFVNDDDSFSGDTLYMFM